MGGKIVPSFEAAVADIPDGASIALFFWGFPGCPQNLIRALRDHGARDLTVISQAWFPFPLPEEAFTTPGVLLPQMRKLITAYFVTFGRSAELADQVETEQALEVETMSHGTLVARLRAAAGGLGGFYSPVGVGTVLEEGKEKRVINGREYLFELPLKPDFGFVKASMADEYGNLVYSGVTRGANPVIAMAAELTIAEVDRIVKPGELDPESIVTPAVFVDRIVEVPEDGPGSYRHTMTRLQELLSIEWARTVFLSTKKEGQQ